MHSLVGVKKLLQRKNDEQSVSCHAWPQGSKAAGIQDQKQRCLRCEVSGFETDVPAVSVDKPVAMAESSVMVLATEHE